MRPARIAIVGTGNIASIHLAALRSLDGIAEVTACTDIDVARLADFCTSGEAGRPCADITELLREGEPDLVHLCTPPALHHQQALSCLRAGVTVLAEKPPTLSLRELDELAAAQREAAGGATGGPWFATVFQHRFGTGARRLRALAAAGVLGRPLLAVCHTTWFRDQAYFDVPWRGRWDTEGGGPTMGHGIHQFDLLLSVLGDWAEVSAVARRQARRTDTEDLSMAHVTFTSGAVASVVNSVVSPREESYLRFDFERATVEVTHLYGYADENWRLTPAPGYEEQVREAWEAGDSGVPSGHRAQFAEVLRCLRAGEPPPVTLPESRRTLALAAAIYASAFTRRPVTPAELAVDSPFYSQMNGDGAHW